MGETNRSSVIFDLIMNALNRTLRAYNRAGRAITPEQEKKALRLFGGQVMFVGVFNTAVAYRAIPNYMHVIDLVIQCFTFVSGIILMAMGSFFVAADNPLECRCLVKFIHFIVFMASALTMGGLL